MAAPKIDTLELRIRWKDAEGQGHEARVSIDRLVRKLAEIAAERGALISISRAL
jgi:hypothetical protein